MFIKPGQNIHQRVGLNLREVLLEVLSFGFGVAELVLVRLLTVLFIDGFSLIHTVIYDAHNKHTINK